MQCPLGSKGNYLWYDFFYPKISSGINDFSAAHKALSILCPRWHGSECWSWVSLKPNHAPYWQILLQWDAEHSPDTGRAARNVLPSLHARAELIYLTCLWQTFIHCFWGILLHLSCLQWLLAFSTLNKPLPENFLLCQVSETVKPI